MSRHREGSRLSDLQDVLAVLEASTPVSESQLATLLPGVPRADRARVADLSNRLTRLLNRDRELSSLIASARDLVEETDASALLQRLVDRAHELVEVDLTYLSEYDEATQGLLVRAARGSVSTELISLRVPVGVGLASRVASTRLPQQVLDYWSGTGLPHDDEVDSAVRAEGIAALLGIPLVANDQVMGVLFVAQRTRRRFTAAEIALLSAFGGHAASAIRTTRLLGELHRAVEHAESSQRAAEEQLAATAQAARTHEELTAHLLKHGGVREIAATLEEHLGCEIAATDPDGAFTAGQEQAWPPRADWWDSRCASVARGRAVTQGDIVVVAASAGMRCHGAFLARRPAAFTAAEIRTLERAAQLMALVTMRDEAQEQAIWRTRDELVQDLVLGRLSDSDVVRLKRAHGLDVRQGVVLAAVGVRPEHRAQTRAALRRHPDWLVGRHAGGYTVAAAAGRLDVGQLEGLPGVAIVADLTPLDGLAACAASLWSCVELLQGLGVERRTGALVEYLPYASMFGGSSASAQSFVDATVAPLVAWDENRGTQLTDTALAYLETGRGITRAAERLFVHPNTVRQRLTRIAALLGSDWDSSERHFRTLVALRLHSLRTMSELDTSRRQG
ncbi:GAF domain-containing protein [Mariniluteicoccus endophyticus]